MSDSGFPDKIKSLEPYAGRFAAYRLAAEDCDVLFASYPAGTAIEPHTHDTDNWGVIVKGEMIVGMNGGQHSFGPGEWYHVPAGTEHTATCHEATEEIEFWFQPDG